ncbi:hypothetical protein CHS0354_013349 [Potamilus streckersoni]|uniref:Uncharacterized protein n=1 Tax=Potamilus streckersoni TaxID=2493646 RepID=A0AAE0W6T9_9BIVA|nr:hypothetical protein CHS0354_013349 [Potamilus streckersoni]
MPLEAELPILKVWISTSTLSRTELSVLKVWISTSTLTRTELSVLKDSVSKSTLTRTELSVLKDSVSKSILTRTELPVLKDSRISMRVKEKKSSNLKKGKAIGEDNICLEMTKPEGTETTKILKSKKYPTSRNWIISVNVTNGIPHRKVMSKIILKRINNDIRKEQASYRKGRNKLVTGKEGTS